MSLPILTAEPREIVQARTSKWTKSLADFPAGTWQLNYSIVYGAVTKTLVWGTDVVASGTDFLVTLPATLITGLTAGVSARLNGAVTSGAEVADVYNGPLELKVVGELSKARQELAALEAIAPTLFGREEQEIRVGGGGTNQELVFRSLTEFRSALREARQTVRAEDVAERVASGLGTGRTIRNRYRQPT